MGSFRGLIGGIVLALSGVLKKDHEKPEAFAPLEWCVLDCFMTEDGTNVLFRGACARIQN